MAVNTGRGLRNQVLYSVFVRQYSPEGTFEALRRDLPRIRGLGTDILWLMPIHPIGVKNRKGSLGSPYAIRDYRAVNPEYGTMDDFRRLADDIHACGMKCLIDVVYNHTSPDSVLARRHPEWFWHGPDGALGSRIGDWSDVADLDYNRRPLWDYQIETLTRWAGIVDGFRCDAASLVPLEFWRQAREAVEAVRPGCLWLAESVDPAFILECRARGVDCLSDGELYQVFDACYDYDIYWDFADALTGRRPLSSYLEGLARQEAAYPANYVKLRGLENHDRLRAAALIPDGRRLRNWTAFLYFQKGLTMLYNGQERSAVLRPGLFDADPVDWSGEDLTPLLTRLGQIKRDPLFAEGTFTVSDAGNGFILAEYRRDRRRMLGLFSAGGRAGAVRVPLADGAYADQISGGAAAVQSGLLLSRGEPLILSADRQEP